MLKTEKYLDCALLGRDRKIDDAMARLDRLTNNELLMTTTETLSQVKLSGRTLVRMEQSNAETRKVLQKIDAETTNAQRDGMMQSIRDSLNPEVATFELFEKLKDELLENSGLWILDESSFSAWINEKIPFLFIWGSPGVGKSFLTCRIVQILRDVHPQGIQDASRASVAFYFYRNNAAGLRSYRIALLTIAYQLAKNDAVYAKHVAGLKIFIQDCRSITSLWQTLFIDFYQRKDCRSTALIVMDGVDEADEDDRHIFLKLTGTLYSTRSGACIKLRVIMTGRPEVIDEIESAVSFVPPKIEINPSKNSSDIKRYVEKAVIQSKSIRRLPKTLRGEIVEKLSKDADGFFLWASLMLQEIEKASRVDVIKRILSNPPRGLTQVLRRVIYHYSQTLEPEEIEDLNVGSPHGEASEDMSGLVRQTSISYMGDRTNH